MSEEDKLVLLGFLDESGHSASTDFVSIGGFIAEYRSWRPLVQTWTAGLEKSGAPYLHMREFAHQRGVFEGWTESGRRQLLGDLLSALTDLPLIAVGTVMRVADFQVLADDERAYLRDPFFLCLQETLATMGKIAGLYEHLERQRTVLCVGFSQQNDFRTLVERHWRAMRRATHYGQWMGLIRFDDMRAFPALQAADLLAYELRHFFHNRQTAPSRRMRWPLHQILSKQRSTWGRDWKACQYLPLDYLQVYRGAHSVSDVKEQKVRNRLLSEIFAVYEQESS